MKQTSVANLNEFPDQVKREKPDIKPLPPSEDTSFWGKDAEIHLINKKELKAETSSHGDFVQKGPYVVCRLCPHEHTMPGYTLDSKGCLVRLDKPIRNI